MGFYPHTDFTKEGDLLVKTQDNFDGAVTKTYYQPVLEIVERTNCYCCSCPTREGSDYSCRNHGVGWGERPCEDHDMPGSGVDPETEEEYPLASVQWYRFENRWAEEQYSEKRDRRHTGDTILERCRITAPHSHWPNVADKKLLKLVEWRKRDQALEAAAAEGLISPQQYKERRKSLDMDQ